MNLIWQFDQSVFRAVHIGLHRDWLDPVFWTISSTGLGWVQALVLAAIGVVLFSKKREGFANQWLTIALSGIASGVINGILKNMIERERPSNLSWALPQEGFRFDSFPSGHTAGSFAIAFALFFVTRGTEQSRWGWVALVWATLVGLSRIYRGVHWPTDVLGGAMVGLFAAIVVVVIRSRERSTSSGTTP